MNAARPARLAMLLAGVMIAHQVAAKSIRDAAFLGAWPASALPLIVIAAAVIVVATVPVYSRWLDRFGARTLVALGFLVSAAGHLAEWRLFGTSPWVTIAIYLHIACLGGLLLSGFWSVISELFDPSAAKKSYGHIAAAGTIGGLAGGLGAAQIARTRPEADALLLLALFHLCSAIGVVFLSRPTGWRQPPTTAADESVARGGLFDFASFRAVPHLKALGLIVMLGAAGAAIADYLLKAHAVRAIGTGTPLLQFFATFYLLVQIATVLAQFFVSAGIRRFGLGRTISALPAGTGSIAALGLLYPVFPLFIAVRGVETVLRSSTFRSAYELIFVPMDPREKHRTKTFLDVTCDRMGDVIGAGVVQLVLITSAVYASAELLAVIIGLSVWGLWLARRLDALYLGVVERRLATHRSAEPIVVGSETGWTVIELPQVDLREPAAATDGGVAVKLAPESDSTIRTLADLRSGERARVERTLATLAEPNAIEVAQIIQLLAWDDLVASARVVLERSAAAHVGLLTDALLDPGSDFAIRRRVPRILGGLGDPRAVNGLVRGLDDARFEVRYQCSRAIRRTLSRRPDIAIDRTWVFTVVERELAVPPQVWHGHRLIDDVEREDAADGVRLSSDRGRRNIEHVFSLLGVVLPPEPLAVALRGIESDDAGLRGVAIEYLGSVLPPNISTRLLALLERLAGAESPGPPTVINHQSEPRGF